VTPYVRRARWRGMAEAWRCCAVTKAVAAPCEGHGSGDRVSMTATGVCVCSGCSMCHWRRRSSACVAEEEDRILGMQGRLC
jgi:hypothetical protein